jgi:hypothetical protein
MSILDTLGYIPSKDGLLAEYHDPVIRFLMDRKFPWLKRISNAPPPGIPVGKRVVQRTPVQGPLTATRAAEVESYEAKLRALSTEDRHSIFNQEVAKAAEERRNEAEIRRSLEENKLYSRWPPADFDHWLRAALWTVDEAVDLSLGKNPDDRFGWNYVSRLLQISEFAKRYENRRLLVHRAVMAGDLPNPMRPEEFKRWATGIQLGDVPDQLRVALSTVDNAEPRMKKQDAPSMPAQAVVRRGEFSDQYAKHIKGGKRRLKEFFDGRTRKSGETPEAARFRVGSTS